MGQDFVFGRDYGVGDIGFTTDDNLFGRLVRQATRDSRKGDIEVSHAFIVVGDDEIVEAQAGEGIILSDLAHHRDNPDTQAIRFRRVRGYTEELGQGIAEKARSFVGQPFDKSPLVGPLLKNSPWVRRMSEEWGRSIDEWLARSLDDRDALFCSELVVRVLRAQEPLQELDYLRDSCEVLADPNELFYADLWESRA